MSELDGLRALLSWWVVTIHLLVMAGIDVERSWVLRELFGETIRVKLFAILSGFVIANLLASRSEPYRTYLTRRILRLYPVYAVCLAVSVMTLDFDTRVLEGLPWQSEMVRQWWLPFHRAGQAEFWRHLAAHVLLLHGLVPDPMLPHGAFAILGQSWNISTELQFYVMAPCLIGLTLSPRPAFRVAGLASFLGLYTFRSYPNRAFLGNYILYFLLGTLSFQASRWLADRNTTDTPRPALAGASVLLTALALATTRNLAVAIWLFVWSSVLVRVFTAGEARFETAACGLLTRPAALYYGRLSYAIYLCHLIVIVPVSYGATRILGDHVGPWGYFAVVGTVSVPLISLLAHVLHVWVEAPVIAWGRRLSRPG